MKTVLSIFVVVVLLTAALPALAQDPVWPPAPPSGVGFITDEEMPDYDNGGYVGVGPDDSFVNIDPIDVVVDLGPCMVITSDASIDETLCEVEPGVDVVVGLGTSGAVYIWPGGYALVLPWNIWR